MMCGGMMLLLIPGAISNSNAVIRQEFRKLRFQMIDDTESRVSLHRFLPGLAVEGSMRSAWKFKSS
ncbi:MAG: hypothetical protein AUH13_08110 [Acidobacteria bacterium 13_2_20CM_58_27]|nr:MAG: hypothetical protein AUH13_08110 [Acidobacteria bacterium 13_2_20CM_58_27]